MGRPEAPGRPPEANHKKHEHTVEGKTIGASEPPSGGRFFCFVFTVFILFLGFGVVWCFLVFFGVFLCLFVFFGVVGVFDLIFGLLMFFSVDCTHFR